MKKLYTIEDLDSEKLLLLNFIPRRNDPSSSSSKLHIRSLWETPEVYANLQSKVGLSAWANFLPEISTGYLNIATTPIANYPSPGSESSMVWNQSVISPINEHISRDAFPFHFYSRRLLENETYISEEENDLLSEGLLELIPKSIKKANFKFIYKGKGQIDLYGESLIDS